MKKSTIEERLFLDIIKAGLWEEDVCFSQSYNVDFNEVLNIAENQDVVGLVAGGLEHLQKIKVPQVMRLLIIGKSIKTEQQNSAKNQFLFKLIKKIQGVCVSPVLVKGQGIAQCYERPFWRSTGDIDLLFDKCGYTNACKLLKPLSSNYKSEGCYSKHLGLILDSEYIELHGSLRVGLSSKLDLVLDEVLDDTFKNGGIRVWHNDDIDLYLPSPDNDVFIIFTHFLKHFFKGHGFCLRQVCDWCRLLWRYREEFDTVLLEKRICKAGLMSEWKSFAALVVEYLGMPKDVMPLYKTDKIWKKKADKILSLTMANDDCSTFAHIMNISRIFPKETLGFLPGIVLELNGLKIKEFFWGNK